METNQIVNALCVEKFSTEDLNRIVNAVKIARDNLRMKVRRSLYVGQAVRFFDSRRGVMVGGKITKLGPKNAYLTADTGTKWVVNPGSLEVA